MKGIFIASKMDVAFGMRVTVKDICDIGKKANKRCYS